MKAGLCLSLLSAIQSSMPRTMPGMQQEFTVYLLNEAISKLKITFGWQDQGRFHERKEGILKYWIDCREKRDVINRRKSISTFLELKKCKAFSGSDKYCITLNLRCTLHPPAFSLHFNISKVGINRTCLIITL